MRRPLVLLKFVVAFSIVVAFSAQAQGTKQTSEKKEAQIWLRKIQTAAQTLNYSGTFIYQQASQVRTSRITHILDGKVELEKLEVLDGKPREYIRTNEEIVSYEPESKTLLIEKRVTKDIFPAIVAAGPSELGQYYEIKKAETGRVAGFDCQAVLLEPRDRLRYGYKLWAEKSSGLLLRAQTLDEGGEAIEQIAFTQVSIGNVDRSRVKPSYADTRGWHVEYARMSQMGSSNWIVRSVPPGFRKIREIKRALSDDSGTDAAHAAPREVTQIVFSDGLAAISVFIEPSTYSRTEGSLQQGAMNIIGKRQGDFWLTIVGEVPPVAIRQVANSIEFKPVRQ